MVAMVLKERCSGVVDGDVDGDETTVCEVASLSATKCSGISQADDDDKDDVLII